MKDRTLERQAFINNNVSQAQMTFCLQTMVPGKAVERTDMCECAHT